jgi:Ca2+-binding EF-hand superfamily protein
MAPITGQVVADEKDAIQDILFFAEQRPIRIRLHVYLEGKPMHAAWREFVSEMFHRFDRNNDGEIDEKEIQIAPVSIEFQAVFGAGFAQPTVLKSIDLNQDGKISLEELTRHFLATQNQPFALVSETWSYEAMSDQMTNLLFDRLDRDKNGTLSLEELGRAYDALKSFDIDEDEMLSASELRHNPQAVYFPQGRPMSTMGNPPLVSVLERRLGYEALVKQIQTRYGPASTPPPERKLRPKDFTMDEADFRKLDTNGDGVLVGEELAGFAELPTDVEVVVRLGKREPEQPALEPFPGNQPRGSVQLLSTARGLRIVLGSNELHLTPFTPIPGMQMVRNSLLDYYLQTFKSADKDGNGYLTKKEAEQTSFHTIFKDVDRNDDNLIDLDEVKKYVTDINALQTLRLNSRLQANLTDQGRGLFGLLDANQDGRLSVRELRSVADRLKAAGWEEGVARKNLPRSCSLTLVHGFAMNQSVGFQQPYPFNATPIRSRRGPLWFQQMDRNGDGDVSPREFLGSAEEFRKLDKDGDGLISADEAGK